MNEYRNEYKELKDKLSIVIARLQEALEEAKLVELRVDKLEKRARKEGKEEGK